jgi:rod shape determining protein RodA
MTARPDMRRLDLRIVGLLLILSVLSLLFLDSAGFDPRTGAYTAFWKKQLVWLLLAAVVLVAVLRVPYRVLLDHAWAIYGFGLALLVLVMLAGTMINNARRWLNLGFMYLQPSEVMKVVLVIALARLIRWRDDYKRVRGLVKPFALCLVPMALILKQPDLGTALLLLPILFAMLFVAGARAKHLGFVVLLGILSMPVVFFGFLEDYQRERLTVFLGQGSEDEHARRNEAYHLERSKIAVGSGGVLGKGLREGAQQVPYNETDFLFTVIAEEWGFAGSLLVLLLYSALLLFVAEAAVITTEPAGKVLITGVLAMLMVQIAINIGMTVGLAPITGLTLPFLSYGGSSLLTFTLAIGLVLNVRLYPDYVFKRDL